MILKKVWQKAQYPDGTRFIFQKEIPVQEMTNTLPQEKDLAELCGVSVVYERIKSWRWKKDDEPERGTVIYQNTPESDVLPPETKMVLDHSWSEVPVSNEDRCGLYLGHGLVLTVRFR